MKFLASLGPKAVFTCVWDRNSVEYPNMSFRGTLQERKENGIEEMAKKIPGKF